MIQSESLFKVSMSQLVMYARQMSWLQTTNFMDTCLVIKSVDVEKRKALLEIAKAVEAFKSRVQEPLKKLEGIY